MERSLRAHVRLRRRPPPSKVLVASDGAARAAACGIPTVRMAPEISDRTNSKERMKASSAGARLGDMMTG